VTFANAVEPLSCKAVTKVSLDAMLEKVFARLLAATAELPAEDTVSFDSDASIAYNTDNVVDSSLRLVLTSTPYRMTSVTVMLFAALTDHTVALNDSFSASVSDVVPDGTVISCEMLNDAFVTVPAVGASVGAYVFVGVYVGAYVGVYIGAYVG
jgi:hypothetical protein